MTRESYRTILGIVSHFSVLVLLCNELSCKNGIPNVSPMLKERQEGSKKQCLGEGEYDISFLHGQHRVIIMKNVNILVYIAKQNRY